MRTTIILGLAVVAISACSTTQREEVRAGEANVTKQEAQLEAAKRDGTINEVQEERKDLRQARRELRKDQNELYQPGSDGTLLGGLQIGQRESGELSPVPVEYLSQYRDGGGSYYRYDGRQIYQFSSADRTVTHIFRLSR